MNQEYVDRIRGDLETLTQAAGLDLPFGRHDVVANICVAACGVLLGAWAALAPWEYRGVVWVPITLLILAGAWSAWQAHRNRAASPSAWREHRLSIRGVLIATPLVAFYLLWQRWQGMPGGGSGGLALFIFGVAALVVALTDRRRVYHLAGAFPLMAWGIAVPKLAPNQVIVAGGIAMTVAGLAAAAIQSVQLRRAKAANGTH